MLKVLGINEISFTVLWDNKRTSITHLINIEGGTLDTIASEKMRAFSNANVEWIETFKAWIKSY